ncbi:MAG: Transposase [Deltaproteobacteria bacterium ADurb.Bin510]|nr:MAG: Transposase [Deltaproteobacteria bacterium ADurb.Bin510]
MAEAIHGLRPHLSIAIDMSPAYYAAVRENQPQAEVVFDHFHVIKLYNEKLADLRRDLYREAEGALEKKPFRNRPTAFGTESSSSSKSTPCMKPGKL